MRGPYRLNQGGIELERQRVQQFRFNGRKLEGYAGDTLASALLGNHVTVVARSLKYRRPRGIFSCGSEEPNALLGIAEDACSLTSAPAPEIPLRPGMHVWSQSGFPSVNWDLGRALDFVAPMWAAGFYNKCFMWPGWRFYEGFIRRMAGCASPSMRPDPDRYEHQNLHCEVLVIGGGVTGLRAAEAAVNAGQRVVLVNDQMFWGGRSAWTGELVDGMTGADWAQTLIAQWARRPNITLLPRTTAVGYHERGVVSLLEECQSPEQLPGTAPRTRQRYWVVRAARVVVATGSIEQPLVFANNDRPGILLAGATLQYLLRFGIAVGRAVVVATNNDSAYDVAIRLGQAGIRVIAVLDTRDEVPQPLRASLEAMSIPLMTATIPIDTKGFGGLSSVAAGHLSSDRASIEHIRHLVCDALAVSGGWNPSLQLYAQAGGRLTFVPDLQCLAAADTHPVVSVAQTSLSPPLSPIGIRVAPVGSTNRQWIDLRHDVTVADLELAVREGYGSIEHVKRYTTVGMSLDQGKTSNLAALQIVARLRGAAPHSIRHTTMRPPVVPVTLGAVAGRMIGAQFAPWRELPMQQWHSDHGAVIEDFGEWKRPAVYVTEGESRGDAVLRERRSVRSAVGLFDGSSLGKIEIRGPDARRFLDFFYINDMTSLTEGNTRYGLMLRESGVIFDDGTVSALGPDHYLITTTSGNARRVHDWFEEWHQCERPTWRVSITPVTEQWATLSLSGPRARDVLSTVVSGMDLAPAAFPHMSVRLGKVSGVPSRISRVSFTGELTYEINVPSRSGPDVWTTIMAAGSSFGLQPIGLDALLQLRIEKGYLHVGTDTDGTTVPSDVGWGKVAAKKTRDFIGKRSLLLPGNASEDRMQLIGLRTETNDIPVGSHIRFDASLQPSDGWVTSAGRECLSGKPIAMALLRGGRRSIGKEVILHDAGTSVRARVVSLPFFDPAGDRLNV